MNQTYCITVFLFYLISLFGATIEDRCSKFLGDGHYVYTLTECPSPEKFNLLECYDAEAKNDSDFITEFWCWSRKDNDEKSIKNVPISTSRFEDDKLTQEINQPFFTQFTFNGTHLKCDSMEKWATESIDVSTTSYAILPCVTNTISVAQFNYYSNVL